MMPHWLGDGQSVTVANAPTVFGRQFGYRLTHRTNSRRVEIKFTQLAPPYVRLIYPCRFGSGVQSAVADGDAIPFSSRDVRIPPGTVDVMITYLP